MPLNERVRTLFRACRDSDVPAVLLTAIEDIANEVQANTDELATLKLAYLGHLAECPHIEPPIARSIPTMAERLEQAGVLAAGLHVVTAHEVSA